MASVKSELSPWLVPSKLQENPLEERLQESSWPPRLQENLLQQLEESRSPTDTGLELLLSVRSEDTRSPLSFSSENFLSSVWWERLLKTSRLTLDFSHLLSWLSRRQVRLTLLDSLRTLTCAPFTPRESPSCPRTSSWPEESEERELNFFQLHFSTIGLFKDHQLKTKKIIYNL